MQGLVRDDACGSIGLAEVSEVRSADTIVCAVNDAIAQKIGQQKFKIWFKNSTRITVTDGLVKIGVANSFIANWLESHFNSHITEAAKTVIGDNCRVTFAIDSQFGGPRKSASLDSIPASAKPFTTQPAPVDSINVTRHPAGNRLKLHFDTFIVGPSNELAYNAAKAVVCDKQSPFNPLFIHGGYGLGKTHLLQGICNELRRIRPTANWLYLSAEDFANQFVLALKTRKLDAFRHRMRQTDLLAIDDIHFLASKPSTQEEFLYTFNTLDLAGRQVILASDAHPKQINQLSEKLVNRFVSGMVVKIETPDFKTRCKIVRQYAGSMKREIDEAVVDFIADNMKSSIRELQGAVLKLAAYASLQNGKIDIAMAESVLAEHIERCDPTVHLSDIESVVAEFFGITPSAVHSSKKDRTVSLARHFCMFLARKNTRMSSSEIGRLLGNKNHATVLVACKQVEEQLAKDSQLNWQGRSGNRVSTAKAILEQLEQNIR
jgi:chromosomal replication initiator protein